MCFIEFSCEACTDLSFDRLESMWMVCMYGQIKYIPRVRLELVARGFTNASHIGVVNAGLITLFSIMISLVWLSTDLPLGLKI